MKFITDDGKTFETMEEAMNHEEKMENAKREREEREQRKQMAYKEIEEKLKELNNLIKAYDELYYENVDQLVLTSTLKFNNSYRKKDESSLSNTLESILKDMGIF